MTLELQGSHALLLLLTVTPIVLFLVWRLYSRTALFESGRMRRVLRALRIAATALVLLLLLHPWVRFRRTETRKPVVGLLLDRSASMTVADDGRTRGETLRKLLRIPAMEDLRSRAGIWTGLFSAGLDTAVSGPPDSLSFRGPSTDFAQTFRDVRTLQSEHPLRSILLISDGRMCAGGPPLQEARALRIPVHAVVIGDSVQKPDLVLDRTDIRSVAYEGRPVQVDVRIRSPGFAGRTVPVTLQSGERVLDRKSVRLVSDLAGQPARLEFTPDETGFQHVSVQLPRLDNEVTHENNQRDVIVRVLKRRIRAVLIAGLPDPDVGWFRRVLSGLPDVEVRTFTFRGSGRFYEGVLPSAQALQETDVLILLDAPAPGFPDSAIRAVQEALGAGAPLLWIAGPGVLHRPVAEFLPFRLMQSGPRRPVEIRPTEAGLGSSLFKSEHGPIDWQRLPSVYSGWSGLEPVQEAAVLAESESGVPLITQIHSKQHKTVALTGSGWRRLDMLMRGIGEEGRMIRVFLENSLRWLMIRESVRPVRIETGKRIFRAGENMTVDVRVLDAVLRPVDDAAVRGGIRSESTETPLRFESVGDGLYRASARSFDPGEHRIVVQAHVQDRPAGRDTLTVMVEPFNPEMLNTTANPRLLRSIARATGGRFGTADSLASILGAMQHAPTAETKTTEWAPLGSWPVLLLLILLLTAEWLIRKRAGML